MFIWFLENMGPEYLCQEIHPWTLFCLTSIKTPKHGKGIPRTYTLFIFWATLVQARVSESCTFSALAPFISPSSYSTPLPVELFGLKSIFEWCLTFWRRFYMKTFYKKCFLWKVFVVEILLKTYFPFSELIMWQRRQRASIITTFYKNLKIEQNAKICNAWVVDT